MCCHTQRERRWCRRGFHCGRCVGDELLRALRTARTDQRWVCVGGAEHAGHYAHALAARRQILHTPLGREVCLASVIVSPCRDTHADVQTYQRRKNPRVRQRACTYLFVRT